MPLEEKPTPDIYSDYFNQAVSNFCGQVQKNKSMPMVALLKPCDKFTALMDHDYLKKTPEEEFLEGQKMNLAN